MEALPLSVGGGVGGEPSRDEGTPHEGGGCHGVAPVEW